MGAFPGLLLYHFSLTVSSSVCKRPSIIQSLVLQLAEAGSETTWKLQSLIITKSRFCRSVIACFIQSLLGLSTMYYFTDYFLFETNPTSRPSPQDNEDKNHQVALSVVCYGEIYEIYLYLNITFYHHGIVADEGGFLEIHLWNLILELQLLNACQCKLNQFNQRRCLTEILDFVLLSSVS